MLERFFRLSEHGTNVRTELLAGLVTFLTMAYIIVVQPAVLSGRMLGIDTGMDFGALCTATCLSAALATGIMALYARYPIALAPGMGENFVFIAALPAAAAVAGTTAAPWQVMLGVVFIAGVLFLALSLSGLREALLGAISPSMKNAIAVGIGLLIAFIGLQNAGVVLKDPGTAVRLNPHFDSPDLIVFYFGLLLTAVLHVRRVPGSILWGMVGATLLAVGLRLGLPQLPMSQWPVVRDSALLTRFQLAEAVIARPPSIEPLFLKMNLRVALSAAMIPYIAIFLFMDLFDTLGTLIGVGEQAGLIKDNKLPRANRAMISDAVGTVFGACVGTSTVTSFIESTAGVEQGGRTGLTALTTAVLFLLALPLTPLVAMVGSYAPIYAPALVIVGSMMIRNVTRIDWHDYGESVPAFLTMIGIPFCYSIADGLALGLIAYPIVKWLGGSGRDVKWLMYPLAVVLLAYFLFVRAGLDN